MDRSDLTIGQPVIITYGDRTAPSRGTVTKIGRVWCEITTTGEYRITRKFRIDDQSDGIGIGHGIHFYTEAQWTERQLRTRATDLLRDQGIRVDYDSPWRGREVELADLIVAHLAAAAAASADTTKEGT